MFTGLLENIEKPPNSLKKKFLSIVLKTSKVEQCKDGKCTDIFFYFQSSYSNDNYQKAYNFKEKMNNSEHWSLFMKKKLKVTIELSGIGGMYTVKAKQKQTSKNNNNKNNYKSLKIILPFPFFFSLFPFRPNISIFLSFILSVCKYFHPFFPFSVNLVFLFVCLVPSVLLQLKIIKSVSIWGIPYLNVIELLVYPFSEDFLIMH